jgi:CBS domain-containing protein
MLVRKLMVREAVTIPATATVAEASRILRNRDVSGAPVVDDTGRPVGVISRTDLALGWEHAETERHRVFYTTVTGEVPGLQELPEMTPFGAKRVSEVMMSLIFSVQERDPVRKAAELMATEGIHRVIVLDGTCLVGVLSASAIVAAVARGELVEAQ